MILKEILTIMFYDPDRGWVEDALETDFTRDREGVQEAFKAFESAPNK